MLSEHGMMIEQHVKLPSSNENRLKTSRHLKAASRSGTLHCHSQPTAPKLFFNFAIWPGLLLLLFQALKCFIAITIASTGCAQCRQ